MIRVWPVDLKPRESFILVGGTKQDKTRALLIAMLPLDGSMYQAADIAKRGWPGKDQVAERNANRKALYDLAHEYGLSGKKEAYSGPDNVGIDGKLLPGHRPGSRQRPKWKAEHWRNIVSDEIWAWCVAFMAEIREIDSKHRSSGRDVEYFYDAEAGLIERPKLQPGSFREQTTDDSVGKSALWEKTVKILLKRKPKPKFQFLGIGLLMALILGGSWLAYKPSSKEPSSKKNFEEAVRGWNSDRPLQVKVLLKKRPNRRAFIEAALPPKEMATVTSSRHNAGYRLPFPIYPPQEEF